jgi:multidrug efflux pump subunit AcrB
MVNFLINRPIAVLMVVLSCIILGGVAYQFIPVSLMPDIPIPEITVNASYPSSSARELENTIIKPLRSHLLQVNHLADIQSETKDGQSIIQLRFDYGANTDFAFVEVNEKIDAFMNEIPRDMERPKVIKANATDIPVFYLNLSLKSFNDGIYNDQEFLTLCEFAEAVIRKRIEQLPEVALVDMSGLLSPQLVIKPNLKALQSLDITLSDLEDIINRNNLNLGSISVKDGLYEYNINFSSLLRTQEDVENIYFKVGNRVFQIKDIATVAIESIKARGVFDSNGKRAISLAVIKKADAKLAKMKDKVKEMVTHFENDYPEIEFEVAQDQTLLLDYTITSLKKNLLQSLVLVSMIMFLFLKNLKSPLLIGVSLLISLIVCMLAFYLVNLSINIISLAGLILAIGNMIDNSIVVIENISSYHQKGMEIDQACIEGTNEIIIPMFSSMLTNIAVFVPLVFMSGIGGALFFDEAISVTIGLMISFLVAITVIPVLYKITYHRKKHILFEGNGKKKSWLLGLSSFFNYEKLYQAGIEKSFKHRRVVLSICLGFIFVGAFVFIKIGKEKIPQITDEALVVHIDWNESIPLEENRKRIYRLLDEIGGNVVQSNSYIGKQQFLLNKDGDFSISESKIYVKPHSPELIGSVKEKIQEFTIGSYPKSTISFASPSNIFRRIFNDDEPDLVARLRPLQVNLEENLSEIMEVIHEISLIKGMGEGFGQLKLQEQIVLEIDIEKLLLYNVALESLHTELKTAFRENAIGTLHAYHKNMPMVIAGNEELLNEVIHNIQVGNNDQVYVPLSGLVTVKKVQDLKTITSGKEGEFVPVAFWGVGNQVDQLVHEIKGRVKKFSKFDVDFTGSVFANMQMLKELTFILLISIMLLYFILAAQFESLTLPIIVLAELPINIAGAMLLLFLSGHSLNIMSAIGIIIMCGIIINDSILKIDIVNKLYQNGYSIYDAIKEGGKRRLRAILMTSFTSILAMVPMLFGSDLGSELQRPFAVALIGGMAVGTMVSLFIVPVLYFYLKRNADEKNLQVIKGY